MRDLMSIKTGPDASLSKAFFKLVASLQVGEFQKVGTLFPGLDGEAELRRISASPGEKVFELVWHGVIVGKFRVTTDSAGLEVALQEIN